MMMSMDHDQGSEKQLFQGSCGGEQFIYSRNMKDEKWDLIEKENYDDSDESSSIGVASTISDGSSSIDTSDDASSSNSANSSGSFCDFSHLMSHLPIKRGLSNFYQGKSQSFTSLSRVGSIEELAKNESAYNKKRKLLNGCKSYGGGLNNYKLYNLPKPIISKKNSRGLLSSSSLSNRKGSK